MRLSLALSSHLFIFNHVSFLSVSLNNSTCHLKPGNTQKRIIGVGVIPGFPDSFNTISSIDFQGLSTLFSTSFLAGQGTQHINYSIYWNNCAPQGHLRSTLLFHPPSLPHLTSETARPQGILGVGLGLGETSPQSKEVLMSGLSVSLSASPQSWLGAGLAY